MKRKIFFIVITIITTSLGYSQEFKGVITNLKKHPLKGIKVWKKNTLESIKTDKMGIFMFPNSESTDTLVISVSKNEEAVIPVRNLKEFIVKLGKKFYIIQDDKNEYRKKYEKVLRINHSSNILTHEQIVKFSANSIYDILKGTLTGVQVSVGVNGQQVSIRGGNSFDLNTEPLFIVDGSQYESSAEVDSSISINDIEKIEVIKDGGMYGMKGSNGVIVITTIEK